MACFAPSVACASSSVCLRDQLPVEQLVGAVVGLLGLAQFGGGLLHVGGLLDRRQMARLGGAVAGERPRQRRLLLFEVVFELFAIELDQHLAGLDAIAEIDEHPADRAVGLRGDRDLIFGGKRADDFDRAADRFLADRLGLHRFGAVFARACPRRLGPGTAGQRDGDQGRGGHNLVVFHRRLPDTRVVEKDKPTPCREQAILHWAGRKGLGAGGSGLDGLGTGDWGAARGWGFARAPAPSP